MFLYSNYKGVSGIYQIKNLSNNKCYIGSAKDLYIRFHNHLSRLLKGNHFNIKLQNAWNKYGEDNFHFDIISFCKVEELESLEQHFIDSLKPYYNIRLEVSGTQRGVKWRKESREKLSKTRTKGPIYEYSLEGLFIKEWSNTLEVVKALKYTPSMVRDNLNGKLRKCKNSIFKYSKESKIEPYVFVYGWRKRNK